MPLTHLLNLLNLKIAMVFLSVFCICCLVTGLYIKKNYHRWKKATIPWRKWIMDHQPAKGLGIFMGSISLIWLALNGVVFIFFTADGSSGTFGDTFGAINSLFSGLAFAGIIFTIFLQMKEFKLQREELRLTSTEFRIQNATLKIQRFENTFFQLLTSYQNLVNDLRDLSNQRTGKKYLQQLYILYRNPTGPNITLSEFKSFESRFLECFRNWGSYDELRRNKAYINRASFNDLELSLDKNFDHDSLIKIAKYYIYSEYDIPEKFGEFYSKNQDDLGRYFRSLFHVYKFIYTSTLIDDKDSNFYADLVSAQLSEYEKVILLYNSMEGNHGFPNFAWLIKEYGILDNLDKELLILPEKDHAAFEKTIPIVLPDTFKIGRRTAKS